MSTIDLNKKQAKADIKQFCKEMHSYLIELEHEIEGEVDQIGNGNEQRSRKLQHECDSMSDDLTIVSRQLETNQGSNRREQLFIALVKARSTIKTLDGKLTSLSNVITVRECRFEPADRLKDVMANVKTLGKLSTRDVVKHVSPQAKIKPSWNRDNDNTVRECRFEPADHLKDVMANVKTLGKLSTRASPQAKIKPPWNRDNVVAETWDGINIRTQSDTETCHITGGTILEGDTTLAVTDWENKSVKLIDVNQNVVVSQIRISSYPFDITNIQLGQLAVTQPVSQKIQFLSVTGTSLSLGREMRVSGQCRGIAANQNDRLFVSFTAPDQVQILNMSSSVLNTISNETVGEELFVQPYSLTLSVDNSLLYVTDSGTSIVYCLDMSGGVKAKYKHTGYIRGVTVADDGSVIMCAKTSNKLHIISFDCSRGKVLVDGTRGLVAPNCVIDSRALSTLYVGDESNTLKVFRLT